MRLTIILSLVAFCGLLCACGGGDDAVVDDTTMDTPKVVKKPAKVWPKSSEKAKDVLRAYNAARKAGNRKQVAEAALQKAEEFALESLPYDALFFHAKLWEAGKNLEKGLACAEEFVANCQDNRNYESALAYLIKNYSEIGSIEKALEHTTTFAETYPDKVTTVGTLQYNVGLKLMPLGRFAEAVKLFESAAERESELAPQKHVECLWALGKYAAARTAASQYATAASDSMHSKRYKALDARAQLLGEPAPAVDVEAWAARESFSVIPGEVSMIYFWNMSKFNAEPMEKRIKILWNQYKDNDFNVAGLSRHLNFDVVKDSTMTQDQELEQLETWKDPDNIGTPWPLGLLAGDAENQSQTEKAFGYWMPPSYCIIDKKGVYRFFYSDLEFDSYAILGKVVEMLQAE